jgi:hypothetical protein
MREEKEGIVQKFFMSEDSKFIKACEIAKVKLTRRQAAKWLRGKGKAFKEGRFSK